MKPGAEKAEKAPVKRRPVLEKTLLDQDVEYLFEKSDQDADLDEQLKEDLRKKKSDPRYIEMQVLSQVKEKIGTTLSEKKVHRHLQDVSAGLGLKRQTVSDDFWLLKIQHFNCPYRLVGWEFWLSFLRILFVYLLIKLKVGSWALRGHLLKM